MTYPQVINDDCPIASSLDVLGQKWTLLIIREALKGARKFSEFERVLRCPKNLLATRLRTLREHGILQLTRYEVVGQRARAGYELTEAGYDLAPTLIALFDWGIKHTAAPQGAQPSRCRCGATVHAVVQCEAGHSLTTTENIRFPPVTVPGTRADRTVRPVPVVAPV